MRIHPNDVRDRVVGMRFTDEEHGRLLRALGEANRKRPTYAPLKLSSYLQNLILEHPQVVAAPRKRERASTKAPRKRTAGKVL